MLYELGILILMIFGIFFGGGLIALIFMKCILLLKPFIDWFFKL